jgi:hypothetical protein
MTPRHLPDMWTKQQSQQKQAKYSWQTKYNMTTHRCDLYARQLQQKCKWLIFNTFCLIIITHYGTRQDVLWHATTIPLCTALFWVTMQLVWVIPYWYFGNDRFFTPETRLIGCPNMLVRNYHYSLHNNPDEHSSHPLHGRSLKSHVPWHSLCVVSCSYRVNFPYTIYMKHNEWKLKHVITICNIYCS